MSSSCRIRCSAHLDRAIASWCPPGFNRRTNRFRPYLQEALRFEEAGTAVIMAIDAADLVTPGLVEARLSANDSDALKKAKVDIKQIATIVSSLKGMMLGITFGKQPYARLKIDFGQDVTPLADIAEPLLLTALEHQGAMLDEMAEWKVEVKGTQIFYSGYLAESGLTRLSSLINLPTNAMNAKTGAASRSRGGEYAVTVGPEPDSAGDDPGLLQVHRADHWRPEGQEGGSHSDRPVGFVVPELCQQD